MGIYTCSEYECSAATERRYGANHYDPLISFDQVRNMKKNCDVAIILYHGGKEHYQYPSPNMQRICRKFVEYGADLVICQHTHCIVCEEKYRDATIVYGQGNVLLDNYEIEVRMTSILVECLIENNRIVRVNYVPIKKMRECVRKADAIESKQILDGFFKRSLEIQKPGFIQSEYDKLAKEYYEGYVRKITGNHRIINKLNRLLGGRIYRYFYNREKAESVINIINTENHAELFAAGLRLIGRDQKPE